MKKYKKHLSKILFFALITSILGLVSCTDYLDKAPQSDIEESDVFKNFRNFQGFVEELYNRIPLMTGVEYHSCWNLGDEEIWEITEDRLLANQIDNGNFKGWETAYYSMFRPGDTDNTGGGARMTKRWWTNAWKAIRKANVGIANLDRFIDGTQEERDLLAGQLYFFRGWYHFMMMQYWGGLPYTDQVLTPDMVFRFPRLNYQETAEKVAGDLEKAAKLLPVDWDQTTVGKVTLGKNNLRINKVMALAYLGKNLLWAGSPLMNQESTGNRSYNVEYCKRAADAFAEALQLCESTGRYELADFSNYSNLFYTYQQSGRLPGLKEVIFYENVIAADVRWRWNQVNDYRPPTIQPTGIKCWPTANYVQFYGMKNGLPIVNDMVKDAESGYDPEYPWKDRDPRFYHDIIIDGDKCVIDGTKVGGNPERQFASLYTGGTYRTLDGAKAALTGYMNSKFTSKFENDWDGYRDNNCTALAYMRLADVYLMYAEATANGYGTPQSKAGNYGLSAVEAVNKIRARAGVDPVHPKFTGSTDSFMSEVRRERAVELAFEGHRFVDLRRWLLLLERPYTLKTSVEFDRSTPKVTVAGVTAPAVPTDPSNTRVLNYRQVTIRERKLAQKHYWFPFREIDVTIYKEFKQNPGW